MGKLVSSYNVSLAVAVSKHLSTMWSEDSLYAVIGAVEMGRGPAAPGGASGRRQCLNWLGIVVAEWGEVLSERLAGTTQRSWCFTVKHRGTFLTL